MKNNSILSIRDLHISFGAVPVVHGLNLEIEAGKTLALVGESGSGKSVTSLAVMGLLPEATGHATGSVRLGDTELLGIPEDRMRSIRGSQISMIFQEPMTSLNPVQRIGDQLAEVIRLHRGLKGAALREAVLEMLRKVRIPDPETRMKQYPHTFSGGMRQRVMIAIAFACDPKLLICDEPTTALDVTIQGQILDIIKDLQKKHNTSVIIITHDLGVVANLAQDIAVMYSGVIVEKGKCADIFYRPRHPYTWALIESVPRLDLENKQELASIPGTPPDLLNPPKGCPFSTRCRYCMEICKEEMPERTDFGDGHMASCWLHHEMAPKVEMPERKGGKR